MTTFRSNWTRARERRSEAHRARRWLVALLLAISFGCSSREVEEPSVGDASGGSRTSSGVRDASLERVDARTSTSDLERVDASDLERVDARTDASDGRVSVDLTVPTCDALGSDGGPTFPIPSSNSLGFDDVSAVVGLPTMYGATASFGDVNDDGWPDVFVPRYADVVDTRTVARYRSVLLLNCGGRFHAVPISFPASDSWGFARVSAIADLDRDGRQDLLVGVGTDLAVVANRPGGAELHTAWSVSYAPGALWLSSVLIVDLDLDGTLDMYVSRFGGDNGLLLGTPGGTFVDVTTDHPELVATSAMETYAASLFGSAADGADDLLYVGNHGTADALLSVHRPLAFTTLANDLSPRATMGVDHFTADDGGRILVTMSDTGKQWLYEVRAGIPRDFTGRHPTLPNLDLWGMRFEDFDNDGFVDLVIGQGAPGPELESESRLLVWRGATPTGETWVDGSSGAGPLFDGSTGGSYYSVATADFDLDGCVDLLVTPVPYYGAVFAQPIKLLRNRCGYPGHWLELTIADDPGAHVVATIQDGDGGTTTRRFETRAASGVASRSMHHQVHIGLGATDRLLGLHVRCRDGREIDLAGADLAVDTVHLRPDICAPP